MSDLFGSLVAHRVGKLFAATLLAAAGAPFVVFALPLVMPLLKDSASSPVLRELLGVEKALDATLPRALRGDEITYWLMVAVTVFLALEANSLRGHFRRKIENLEAFRQFEALSAPRRLPSDARVVDEREAFIRLRGETTDPGRQRETPRSER